MTDLLIRNAEVNGVSVDVRVRGGRIVEIGAGLEYANEAEILQGNRGALIPGLHDHHIHLLASAAAEQSIPLGPPQVRDRAQFVAAILEAAADLSPHDWLRGIGYHESVAGELDRDALDTIAPTHPVRVQHRSGALWILNTRGLQALGIYSETGRLFGADHLMRELPGNSPPPPLAPVGARLASYGVTGVTDATPSSDLDSVELLARAVRDGDLPQSVVVTGGAALSAARPTEGVRWGPVKFVIADHALPTLDALREVIELAHRHRRSIAFHCVTHVALALALAAWNDVGVHDGDRIEHGALVTPEAASRISELGLTVVTQPGFIATRGDEYLADVETEDLPNLYRCASLLAEGIDVGGSTDAPFGDLDPWKAIAAATERRTESGVVLGGGERIASSSALELFLAPLERPGGPTRHVAAGVIADLCLLDAPLAEVLEHPSSNHVVATLVGGRTVYLRV